MKRILSVVLALSFLVSWASSGLCAEGKIGVVDMSQLVKAHPDTQPADSLLEKQAMEFKAEQREMGTEFDKLKKAFEAAVKEIDNKALSDEARDLKRKSAEEKDSAKIPVNSLILMAIS